MWDGVGFATDGSGFKARPCQDRVIKARRHAPEVKDTHTQPAMVMLTWMPLASCAGTIYQMILPMARLIIRPMIRHRVHLSLPPIKYFENARELSPLSYPKYLR